MPQFVYKARRRTGELIDGVIEAPDRAGAVAQLERLGLFPVFLDGGKATPEKESAPHQKRLHRIVEWLPPVVREFLFRPRRPPLREMAMFTQQLANLLKAGMSMSSALKSMTTFKTRHISQEVSRQLLQDVIEGRSLSDAMARQKHIFSDLYVNMVRAGEQSGALVDVLRRMAAHFEQFAELQGRFTSALIYPALVVTVGIIIVTAFLFFILPQFVQMFQELEINLPWPTRMLISFTHFVAHYWWLILLVIVTLSVLVRRYATSPQGRRKIDELKLKLPVVGRIMRLYLYAQFARTLAILLQNGVPMLTALRITEEVVPNSLLKEAVAATRDAVTDGKSLAQPLARSGLFPEVMVDLVKIGEEIGNVPETLNNIAETMEGELQISLRVLINMIEPILIIAMAVVVVFLLLSVLMPIFTIVTQIRAGTGMR